MSERPPHLDITVVRGVKAIDKMRRDNPKRLYSL